MNYAFLSDSFYVYKFENDQKMVTLILPNDVYISNISVVYDTTNLIIKWRKS